jgi:peptide deformylase
MSIMKTPAQMETEGATESPAAGNPGHETTQTSNRFAGSGLASSRREPEERTSAAGTAPAGMFAVHRGSRRSGGHDPGANHRWRMRPEETILPILKITGEDRKPLEGLRQASVDVTEFNEDLRQTVGSMIDTLFAARGLGLAAPQIGRNLNLFVMRTHAGIVNDNREVRVAVNPTVIETGERVSTQIEHCLSIPGISGRVTRFHQVGCVYRDEYGQRHEESLEDMEARIFQHEIDHLLGKLFVDLADKFYRPEV